MSVEKGSFLNRWYGWPNRDLKGLWILLWILSYLSVTVVYRLSPTDNLSILFSVSSTVTQTLLDVLICYQALRLRPDFFGFPSGRYLLFAAFASEAVADFIYGSMVNVLHWPDPRGGWGEVSYNGPFLLFLWCLVGLAILTLYRQLGRWILRLGVSAVFVALILFYWYFSKTILNTFPLQTIFFTTFALLAQALLIVASVLFAYCGLNAATQLFGSGLLTICSVNLLLQYLEFSGRIQPGIPFEALWAAGQAGLLCGLARGTHRRPAESLRILPASERAKWILSLLGFVVFCHFLWRFFIQAVVTIESVWIEVSLFIIFVALVFIPLTFLFQQLNVLPLLRLLHAIEKANTSQEELLVLDEEIARAGRQVQLKLSRLEKAEVDALAVLKTIEQLKHDIRSPVAALNVVSGSIMKYSRQTGLLVDHVAKRIDGILQDLDAWVRNQESASRTLQAKEKAFELVPAIERIILEKQAGTSPCKIELFVEPSTQQVQVHLDQNHFGRLLSNLLNNSFESIPEGKRGRIEIHITRAWPERVRLEVRDNGRGIPPEVLPILLTRGGSHAKQGGSGLGLSHAKETIEAAQGIFEIASRPGQGTVVTLTLPAS